MARIIYNQLYKSLAFLTTFASSALCRQPCQCQGTQGLGNNPTTRGGILFACFAKHMAFSSLDEEKLGSSVGEPSHREPQPSF